MFKKMELLAPGGDVESIKAAIIAGADAVYCGLNKFNARNRATNITLEQLPSILRLAHAHQCEVFITLNIIILEGEIPDVFRLLNKLAQMKVDGIIVQDLGLFYILSTYFKDLKVHASTQLTTHNEGQIKFLAALKATRVNLSRELALHEIAHLSAVAHAEEVLTEVFVHGSYCISFSGLCYMSSMNGGNSGNRGRCSQPCREAYKTTSQGVNFPLNLKDNSAYFHLRELYDVGVDSLKVEGRIKKFHYVYVVIKAYREQLQRLYQSAPLFDDDVQLHKVFNRDFSTGFLDRNIGKEMFIDHPRDHASRYIAQLQGRDDVEKVDAELYAEKGLLRTKIEQQMNALSVASIPLDIIISGYIGDPLELLIRSENHSFVLKSNVILSKTGAQPLSLEMVMKRFKAINDTAFYIDKIQLALTDDPVFLPFHELTNLKKRLLFELNGGVEYSAPVPVPVLTNSLPQDEIPSVSVLISSTEDLYLCEEPGVEVYFQLPNNLQKSWREYVVLFQDNRRLIPWFPSLLIGEDYTAALQLLQALKPPSIVSNNTGLGFAAFELGISWVAGPHLNLVNSYALLCLKEQFNCSGAFVSNEINAWQIKQIKRPHNFKLYYSVYHPISLMASRQCLFQQVVGCEKESMDSTCLSTCKKQTSIENLNNETFFIEKKKGQYNQLYYETNALNTEICVDVPHVFSSFLLDFSGVKTLTVESLSKLDMIRLYKQCLGGDGAAQEQLHSRVVATNIKRYLNGL